MAKEEKILSIKRIEIKLFYFRIIKLYIIKQNQFYIIV